MKYFIYERIPINNLIIPSDIYKEDLLEFDVDRGKDNKIIKEKRSVIWANAEELVQAIVDKLQIVGGYQIKVMKDGGQSFF